MTRGGLLVWLVIALGTQLAAAASSAPPTPVFHTNYRIEGELRLPYAELNEPFKAFYDKPGNRSRTDYYGNLYQIYQFGVQNGESGFGAMYKLAWVPASFQKDGKASASLSGGKTLTKRACFQMLGSIGNEVQAQTVLPSLTDFAYDSTGPCPRGNLEHRHASCELWTMSTQVGDKKNIYKMWIRRNQTSGLSVPVFYYMLGYDSLLGSHYDRYDIAYYRYQPNAAVPDDFSLNLAAHGCRGMPGPGDSAAARRLHLVEQNPIHEYVVEPHNYEHIEHAFGQFAAQHAKQWAEPAHERASLHNFLHNLRFINSKNRELSQYKLAVNRYADNNVRELAYLRGRRRSKGYNGGLDYAAEHELESASSGARSLQQPLPESWDWRLQGAVTPVKDQAVCGSCWSFGTSGSVEGAYFVKTGKLVRLSQQQMIDCSWAYGNNACDGGEDFRAYKYIEAAGGLASEEDYGHYLGVDGRCHDQDVAKSVKIAGFYNVTANNVEHLKHAIINYGPVSISIDASRPTFTFYSHGLYFDPKCQNGPDSLDHSVLAVGYAQLDGKLAWLVKNSWSTNWGNDGYILMAADQNNCGVLDAPTVPKIVL